MPDRAFAWLMLVVAFVLSGALYASAWAGDGLLDGFEDAPPADGDVLLEGFDDTETIPKNVQVFPSREEVSACGAIGINGHVRTAASYSFAHTAPAEGKTDWRGLSRLKTELLLELEVQPAQDWSMFASGLASHDFAYRFKGRDNYTQAVIDQYETEVELRELYLQGSLAKQWDIKIGRQIAVWGTSDYLRVVDIINPLDMRDPVITDIEDLRLPVAMTKLDYYWGGFSLSGIAIHETRFNKNPPFGSDCYPYSEPSPDEEIPDSTLGNTQFALALTGTIAGWDIGIYWADVYKADAYATASKRGDAPVLVQKHPRAKMLGASSAFATGNWLIKGEAAYWRGLKYTTLPQQSFTRMDLMAGFEYSGFRDTRITLEIVNQHLFDYSSRLNQYPDILQQDQLQSVICVEKDFMNERLTLSLLASAYGYDWRGGSFQRFYTEYDIADAFTVRGGVLFFQSGNMSTYKGVGNNDKVFLEFKYSF